LVAACGGVWLIASTLTSLDKHVKANTANLETKFDNLETKFDNLETKFDNLEKSLNAKLDVIVAAVVALTGVPNALRSMGLAVQQVADGQPVSALAAATPAQQAALLRDSGFGQYAEALGHLSGAEALLQTDASLRAQGVADGHAKPLLELLSKQREK
jgi:uncharacterized protein YoxC